MSDFSFFAPLTFFQKADAPAGQTKRIAGVISTELRDKQKEVVLQRGLDFAPFLNGGWFNDNHSKNTTDVLGFPTDVKKFQKGERLPDGSTAKSNGTWAEGYLLDTPQAAKVWDLGLALAKAGSHRRLGFSIEGQVLQRTGPDSRTVAKALVRNVAITNCFPGYVRPTGPAQKVTRRQYSGPMVEVVLTTGQKLTGTPNHPVLTQRGWVGLGELDESVDRVGCFNRDPPAISPRVPHDEQDMPPTFEEIFDLARVTGIETRPVGKGQFHGDVLTDSDVDVVLPNGPLKARLQAAFTEKFGKDALPASDKEQGLLAVVGAGFQFVLARFRSTAGLIGGLGQGFALVGIPSGISPQLLFTLRSDNAPLGGDVVDRPPVNTEVRGNDAGRILSKAVRFSNLVSKRVFDFSGHVFNLDSALGWYEANGIVAHNCPVGDDTRMEVLAKSLDEAEKSLTTGGPAPGVNPSAIGPTTGTAGRIITPQHLEEEGHTTLLDGVKKPAAEEPAVEKSLAVEHIRARIGCDQQTAERTYAAFINLKQHGML